MALPAAAIALMDSRVAALTRDESPFSSGPRGVDRAAAYGWPQDIATEDALARLLALNLERAKAQAP